MGHSNGDLNNSVTCSFKVVRNCVGQALWGIKFVPCSVGHQVRSIQWKVSLRSLGGDYHNGGGCQHVDWKSASRNLFIYFVTWVWVPPV